MTSGCLENSKITSPDANLRIGSALVGKFSDTLKLPKDEYRKTFKIGLKG